jgi:type IV secretory pathway VirB2 component (pilin)
LDILALAGSTGVSIFTMVRCRQTWQFLLLGVWKFTMAFSAGCVYTHRSLLVRHTSHVKSYMPVNGPSTAKHPISYTPLFWLIVYAFGVIVGMAGLGSLVSQNWDEQHVPLVTFVFGGVALGIVITVAIITFIGVASKRGFSSGLKWSTAWMVVIGIVAVGLLAAFYSDWVLGAMVGNVTGSPSSDNAVLYWGYFVAKRLPIFSW